mmetsp:Transcript_137299/g.194268  ORF Transcript_137299/g.194268 Transcript_137299/m.194268 type:complete len:149 (+) Transcript_137299:50-496(+)
MLANLLRNKVLVNTVKEFAFQSTKNAKSVVYTPYAAFRSAESVVDLEKAGKLDKYSRENLKKNRWLPYDQTHEDSLKTHKSMSEKWIHEVPVIYMNSNVVRCTGGSKIEAGHPQVYLQLDTRNPGKVVTCPYCGLRYARKLDNDDDHE